MRRNLKKKQSGQQKKLLIERISLGEDWFVHLKRMHKCIVCTLFCCDCPKSADIFTGPSDDGQIEGMPLIAVIAPLRFVRVARNTFSDDLTVIDDKDQLSMSYLVLTVIFGDIDRDG